MRLAERLQSNYSWAKWIEAPKRGPAENRNYGAAQAKHEWLVFTDDDCAPGRSRWRSNFCRLLLYYILGLNARGSDIRSFIRRAHFTINRNTPRPRRISHS